MNGTLKKYMPYAVTVFAIFLIVPMLFKNEMMAKFYPVALYFIFPGTAIVSSALFCAKYGLDFLFALIAPISFIPSMLIYNGGFGSEYIMANILLVAVYLVAGIFGLFVGDIALGDKRRRKEDKEKAEAEEFMLKAQRRDEREKEKRAQKESPSYENDDDDFDYDKYLSDMDKPVNASDAEIDDILSEFGSNRRR